jgi:hypothetical protein
VIIPHVEQMNLVENQCVDPAELLPAANAPWDNFSGTRTLKKPEKVAGLGITEKTWQQFVRCF